MSDFLGLFFVAVLQPLVLHVGVLKKKPVTFKARTPSKNLLTKTKEGGSPNRTESKIGQGGEAVTVTAAV